MDISGHNRSAHGGGGRHHRRRQSLDNSCLTLDSQHSELGELIGNDVRKNKNNDESDNNNNHNLILDGSNHSRHRNPLTAERPSLVRKTNSRSNLAAVSLGSFRRGRPGVIRCKSASFANRRTGTADSLIPRGNMVPVRRVSRNNSKKAFCLDDDLHESTHSKKSLHSMNSRNVRRKKVASKSDKSSAITATANNNKNEAADDDAQQQQQEATVTTAEDDDDNDDNTPTYSEDEYSEYSTSVESADSFCDATEDCTPNKEYMVKDLGASFCDVDEYVNEAIREAASSEENDDDQADSPPRIVNVEVDLSSLDLNKN